MLQQCKDKKGAVKHPFVVALTGGIASGKSTVSRLFAEQYGICVVDADVVAREVVAIGEPSLLQLADHFGTEVLKADGSLNRAYLKQSIFSNAQDRAWVNALLHPRICARMIQQLSCCHSTYAIAVIPLLAEMGVPDYVDYVLVVDCDESLQYNRLIARDAMTSTMAQSIINVQASREVRLSIADGIIDNSESEIDQSLRHQVNKWHQQFLINAQLTYAHRQHDEPKDSRLDQT